MKSPKIVFLIQGIILLILGILFLMNPVQQGLLFLTIMGIFFTVSGIAAILTGIFKTKGFKYKILQILEGFLLGGFGLVFFLRNPARGAVLVIYSVVILMIIMAFLNTVAIFNTKSGLKWFAIVLNVLIIWFGIQSLLDPQLAVAIFYWTVAFQLIFMGINHMVLFFLLPKASQDEA